MWPEVVRKMTTIVICSYNVNFESTLSCWQRSYNDNWQVFYFHMMQNNILGNVDKLHHRVLKTNVIQYSQGNSQWVHCRSKVVWDNVSDNCSEGLHKYMTVDVNKQYLYEPLTIDWSYIRCWMFIVQWRVIDTLYATNLTRFEMSKFALSLHRYFLRN